MSDELREKVSVSIERIKAFEPQDGYYLAYSGGKDSTVLLNLADRANVRYEAHYSVTTVDPPELVEFIISQFDTFTYVYWDGNSKDFKRCGRHTLKPYEDGILNNHIYFDIPKMSMPKLIASHTIPPTRIARYCCAALKEPGGQDRVVLTGVRWAESANRKNTHGVVDIQGKPKATQKTADEFGAEYKLNKHGYVIMNDDNDEARRMVEHCYRTQKTIVNPIVDWTDQDVWDFIKGEGLSYCSLYDKGFKRIGCIGCPLGGFASQKRELNQYPAIRNMYIAAFDKMLKEMQKNRKPVDERWKDGESIMKWWTGGFEGVVKGQISVDELLEGD